MKFLILKNKRNYLKKIKRYFWHGAKWLMVVTALGLKYVSHGFNRNIKRKLINWINKIDRTDDQWREDDLVIDILRYGFTRLFDIKRYIRQIYLAGMETKHFLMPPVGTLSWRRVFRLSAKNLTQGKARMWVTVMGVAVGIGAIVLLVSFGYGLEKVVTQRIIWPQALKVAEVTSESAAVKLDAEVLQKIKSINNVVEVSPSIRLAGQVTFNGSKMDVVVIGANSNYLNLGDLKLTVGTIFSDGADKNYTGGADLTPALAQSLTGEVAGVATVAAVIHIGDPVATGSSRFRIRDNNYTPVYTAPKKTAMVVGYVRGSVVDDYQGNWVWGGVYDDTSGWGRVNNESGALMGKWLKTTLPLWQDLGNGVYQQKTNESGNQVTSEGYLMANDVTVLSETEAAIADWINGGMVLGEASSSAEATKAATLADSTMTKVGTLSASLVAQLAKSDEKTDEIVAKDTVVAVREDNPKELIVSSGLVRAWNKKPAEILGSQVAVEYIVTSSILPSINGRIFSDKTNYKIVGIFNDDTKPMAYVPLGDIESMGVKLYSSARVLANSEENLAQIRTVIQAMGFVTRSVADTLNQIVKLFSIIRFLLGSFGAIALVVALFGMFNTLTVSLLERTREIGVMKSLGTTNFDVKRIFWMESVLISLTGGSMGIALGLILGRIINTIFFRYSQNSGQILFTMPISFAFFILFLSVIVGLATGWYPSRRAAKISALNALRYE